MSKRVCNRPGYPVLISPSEGGRCLAHRREHEQQRGTSTQRGYGIEHQRKRLEMAPLVAAGNVRCSRCGEPILPGQAWDADHRDDRVGYRGPSHASCNRATSGRDKG